WFVHAGARRAVERRCAGSSVLVGCRGGWERDRVVSSGCDECSLSDADGTGRCGGGTLAGGSDCSYPEWARCAWSWGTTPVAVVAAGAGGACQRRHLWVSVVPGRAVPEQLRAGSDCLQRRRDPSPAW